MKVVDRYNLAVGKLRVRLEPTGDLLEAMRVDETTSNLSPPVALTRNNKVGHTRRATVLLNLTERRDSIVNSAAYSAIGGRRRHVH